MHKLETEILVIGGGATGTGVAWDAALRGFKVVLVERRDLAHGTSFSQKMKENSLISSKLAATQSAFLAQKFPWLKHCAVSLCSTRAPAAFLKYLMGQQTVF